MSLESRSEPLWFGNEHQSLRLTWQPIAETAELSGNGPHPVRLLGDDYALWHDGSGWKLLPDTCPHRLAPLTAGVLIDGQNGQPVLQCAYHGWCFDSTGTCVEVPALGPGRTVPATAHLRPANRVEEHYNILWAALDEPVTSVPAFPEWKDPGHRQRRSTAPAVPLAPGIETNTKADRITVELRRLLADLATAMTEETSE